MTSKESPNFQPIPGGLTHVRAIFEIRENSARPDCSFPHTPRPGWLALGNAVVSRKTHGSAGDFDIDLLPPAPGIECREGQPSAGAHKIVFTFAVPVTFTTADCGGSGSLNSGEIALVKSKSGTALP
jgi:hypothetical protein